MTNAMKTLQIRDFDPSTNVLKVDLGKILNAIGEYIDSFLWGVTKVQSTRIEFEVIGKAAKQFDFIEKNRIQITNVEFIKLAKKNNQIIWAQFEGYKKSNLLEPCIIIRAVDSSYFEVSCNNKQVINNINSAFNEVTEV